jgi:hypothetical protein
MVTIVQVWDINDSSMIHSPTSDSDSCDCDCQFRAAIDGTGKTGNGRGLLLHLTDFRYVTVRAPQCKNQCYTVTVFLHYFRPPPLLWPTQFY